MSDTNPPVEPEPVPPVVPEPAPVVEPVAAAPVPPAEVPPTAVVPPAAPVAPPAAYAPEGPKTNVLGIVSLVTAILGLSIVAVITGHIALGQIKKRGEAGHGLALAGTIIGWVGCAIWVIFWIVVIVSGAALFAFYDPSYYY